MSADNVLAALENRIWDLVAWRNSAEQDIVEWTLRGPGGEERSIRVGDRWDVLGWPARLSAELASPAPEGTYLELSVGGQGLVFLDGTAAGGLDAFHREFPVGGVTRIAIQAVPKGLFGVHNPAPRLETARLVLPDVEARALHQELETALAAARELAGHDAWPLLIRAIEETLALVRFPSASEGVLAQLRALQREYDDTRDAERYLARPDWDTITRLAVETAAGGVARVSHRLGAAEPAPLSGPSAVVPPLDGVTAARELLRRRLGEIVAVHPPAGRLAVCGHAHIDVAWLWPLEETRRKTLRTFSTVLGLMERFPDFRFNQSSAQLHAFVQEEEPELFERIRARVREGRWEPIGGMWIEPDCNLPSGESLVRQLLYGQRYFEREFGRRSSVAWLPDSFGFSGALPQILAGGGMKYFFTQKLTWNETNRFPYDLWRWEGIDGTRLVAHSFTNPVGGYNGRIEPRGLLATWRNFREKDLHPESLFTYGYGDGGGGPTADMLERYDLLRDFPVLPRLRRASVEEFFSEITPEGLPVWVGELYLELHRGTYTTQARIKHRHRAAEQRLFEAEAAATWASLVGGDYPRARLDRAWTTLLRNEFHDILPGSSIREVNEEAERELAEVVGMAERMRDDALGRLAADVRLTQADATGALVVFNLHGAARPLSCRATLPAGDPAARLLAPEGREVVYQRISDAEVLLHDPEVCVPGAGYLALAVVPGESGSVPSRVTATETEIENDRLRVRLAADGALASVFDKRAGREVLDGTGNQLWAYHDQPRAWDAWDIDAGYETSGERVDGVESVRVLAAGPLEAVVEVVYRYRSSRIVQCYALRAGSPRLEIRTRLDWSDRRVLLRALFPLAVRAAEATFETAFGAVSRPTYRNTSWDAARFEVPGHRWADLSEAGYGVSLLNDGKYGHSARGNVLGLSLLRSPVSPDPYADAGAHAFTYALLAHAGDWWEGDTVREALDLNSPLVVVRADIPASGVPSSGGAAAQLLRVDGLTVAALKRAEGSDDVIVRLYDPRGGRGVAEVEPFFPVARAALVNLLEDEIAEIPIPAGAPLRLPYRPFQILTLRLTVLRSNGGSPHPQPLSQSWERGDLGTLTR